MKEIHELAGSDLPPMHTLRAFEAAARLGSFAATAERLHLTPSAVSHQIRALEDFIGRPLFERVGREVRVTGEGGEFADQVRATLLGLAAAADALRRRPRQEVVTLSVTPAFASGWLVPRLAAFQLVRPGLEVRLSASLELVDFARSDVDLAVRYGDGDWPGLVRHRLIEETLIPVCAPGLCGPDGRLRSLEDLHGMTLIHILPRLGDWKNWALAAGLEDLPTERGPKFNEAGLAMEAAAEGLGVAIANRRLVERELETGRLVQPLATEFSSSNAYYLVYPRSREPGPGAAAFRDWLLAEFEAGAGI